MDLQTMRSLRAPKYWAVDAVEDGKEKEGNGTGGPDGGQGIGAENLTHDHRIRQVIGLLEEIADEQGKSKNRKQGQGPAFCHIHGGRMPAHGCRLHRKKTYLLLRTNMDPVRSTEIINP